MGIPLDILFSANISQQLQQRLIANYPDQTFTFCKGMEDAREHLSRAEILVTYGEDLSDELIQEATQLKWIMVISAGMDKMPFSSIKERNIIVTNVRGIHKVPMAEYAISMLLQVYRQEKVLIAHEKASTWDRSVKMQEITGQTMLIAGTGAIGQEVARLAKAFQMTTYGMSRSGKSVEFFDETYVVEQLDEILPNVDFVVSVLPSTAETKGLFTYDHFKSMPEHAVFLNMGRGDVVKTDVILQAIQNEEIAHAVLDVFEQEPLPADHPLWKEERVTVTPHLSGISPQYQPRAIEIFEQNLDTYIEEQDCYINKVDVSRGY